MSYCRWSSAEWRSDVYCYSDVYGGYTTHVAANRVVGEIPPVPDQLLHDDPNAWATAHERQMAFLRDCKREPIGLAHDGQSFNDSTLSGLRDRLLTLRAEGYFVPDSAFERIDRELAEGAG